MILCFTYQNLSVYESFTLTKTYFLDLPKAYLSKQNIVNLNNNCDFYFCYSFYIIIYENKLEIVI